MGLCMHLDYGLFYIPLPSKKVKFKPEANIFLVKNTYCCVGPDFWGGKKFWQANRRKHILPLEKLWRTLSLVLLVHTFFSHFHFFKVAEIMLKYGDLMLPAWYILDPCCIRYSVSLFNAAPFCEIIQSFIWCKTLRKGIE